MEFIKENLGDLLEGATNEVIKELVDHAPQFLAGSVSASLDSASGVPLTTAAKVLHSLTRKALQNKQDVAIQAEVIE